MKFSAQTLTSAGGHEKVLHHAPLEISRFNENCYSSEGANFRSFYNAGGAISFCPSGINKTN